LPGAIWPLVQLRLTSELTLGLTEMLVTASAVLPLFVIVRVVDRVVPTVTSPSARLPLSVMTRVDVVGDVGEGSESPHRTAASIRPTVTARRAICSSLTERVGRIQKLLGGPGNERQTWQVMNYPASLDDVRANRKDRGELSSSGCRAVRNPRRG